MTDDPNLTPDDFENLMARFSEHLVSTGQGELDEERFKAAADAVLSQRRSEPGSRADEMIAKGATMFVNRVERDGVIKVEFLLGWPDSHPDEQFGGKTFSLGFVPLSEMIRGGQG